jgi:outer membrane protein OmpA-like peptidoglycan-associated protein
MGISVKHLVIVGSVAPFLAACVSTGQYNKDLAETLSQITAEKDARVAADNTQNADVQGVKSDVAGLKTDVAGLHNDLQNLRTEFGAKITALESGIQFNVPVNFAFDDATVNDQDHASLDRFASIVQKYYPGSKLTIEGFADPAGGTGYNKALSLRRADAVKDYLVSKGLSQTDVKTVGYGKTRLVVPNASHDDPGAQLNRRVVFVIETKSDMAGKTASTTSAAAGVAGQQ